MLFYCITQFNHVLENLKRHGRHYNQSPLCIKLGYVLEPDFVTAKIGVINYLVNCNVIKLNQYFTF